MINPKDVIKEKEIIFNEKEDFHIRRISIRKLRNLILNANYKIKNVKQIVDEIERIIKVLINVIKTKDINYILICDSAYALGKIKYILLSNNIEIKNEKIKENLIELYKNIESFNDTKAVKKAIKKNVIMAFMAIAGAKEGADQIKNEIITFIEKESDKEIRRFLNELKKQCESFYGRDYKNHISDSEINPLNYIEDEVGQKNLEQILKAKKTKDKKTKNR